jgi:hypothetical protein
MKKLKINIRPLLLLLLMIVMSYIYTIINHKIVHSHNLTTRLDAQIPIIRLFVLPYISWHIFIPVIFIILCLMDKKTYFKIMLVYVIGCLLSNIIFILYQTTMVRAPLTGNDILTNLMKFVYSKDNPINCFPSIHVFTSYLMIRAVFQSNFSNLYTNLITSTIGCLIIASTVFIKQHGILDVISGILLAEALIITVNHFEYKLLKFWNKRLFSKFSLNEIFGLNTSESDCDNNSVKDDLNINI